MDLDKIGEGKIKEGLRIAKRSIATTLARLDNIPESVFVNDLYLTSLYIDHLGNWLGIPKWKGWKKIKTELRVKGFHLAIKKMENLYETIALAEKHDLLPKGKGKTTDFSKEKAEELERKKAQ